MAYKDNSEIARRKRREALQKAKRYWEDDEYRQAENYRSRVTYWRRKGHPNPEERAKKVNKCPHLTPEQKKEVRQAASKKFYATHPHYMRDYFRKPENKVRQQEYQKKRYKTDIAYRLKMKTVALSRYYRLKEQKHENNGRTNNSLEACS